MDSYGNMTTTSELVIRLREWERQVADDRWRRLVAESELDDDDGPETWAGLFA